MINGEDRNSVKFNVWIRQWLETHYALKTLSAELIILFNIHSGYDLQLLVNQLDQILRKNQHSRVIWVLEDSLLFLDLVDELVRQDHIEQSRWLLPLLKERIKKAPLKKLKTINDLRTPIKRNRKNYIPHLPDAPRVEYLLRNPHIGVALESQNNTWDAELAHSIHIAKALKWKAFSALINNEDNELFLNLMTRSIKYYVESQILNRDKLFAQKLYSITRHYPHALIITDRGLDHRESLLVSLKEQRFQDISLSIYTPAAYVKENYSYLRFAFNFLNKKRYKSSKDDQNVLLISLKRLCLHEMLTRTMTFHFPEISSVAISNVAQNFIEAMDINNIKKMLYIIQRKNKEMTYKEKQRASNRKILKWFIDQAFVPSIKEISKKLNAQSTGYIKSTHKIGLKNK